MYGMLTFLCLAGILNLFIFQNYIKRIFSLSVAYSSFVMLMLLLFLKNENLNEMLMLMVSVLMIFSINLLIGIGIVKNISENNRN